MANQLLKKIFIPVINQTRSYIKNKVSRGGIQYHGFKYHPRHENFQDPPYEPTKLFLVTRIKHVWGSNPHERHILQILNIDGHKKTQGHRAIVKNIPEVNKYLWKIKHMVTIVPIQCPQGLPQDDGLGASYLHDSGVLEVSPKLQVNEDRLASTEAFEKNPKRITTDLLKKHLRYRWMNPLQGTMNDC